MHVTPLTAVFSHPDTHLDTTSGPSREEQRSYTDLFREPVDVPPQSTGEAS